jgi:type IV pilus assembly protein PilO
MMKLLADIKNIDIKNINLKDRKTQVFILITLITVMAFILYLNLIFFPQIIRTVVLIGKTIRLGAELKSARSITAQESAVKKNLDEYKEKVELYEKKLPVEKEIPNLLENLSNMAKNSKIKIVGIAPALSYLKDQKSAKSRIYQEIPILITAKSGYHELGYFLASLEDADRFIKVVDISIKANKATQKIHDVELMVCTYILFPEK